MNFGLELCCQIQIYDNFYSNLLGITQFTFLRQKVKKFLDEKKMKRRENGFFYIFSGEIQQKIGIILRKFFQPSSRLECVCQA